MNNTRQKAGFSGTSTQTVQATAASARFSAALILALCCVAVSAVKAAPAPTLGGTQTITLIDQQAGNIPLMTLDIPRGWTHELQTAWNKNNEPKVTTHVTAKDPNGTGTYYINPVMIFYDIPELNGRHFKFSWTLTPKEAVEYMMRQFAAVNPKVAALNHRVIRVQPEPDTPNTKTAFITAEYTEDGIPKHEVIAVSVQVTPDPYATMWVVAINGCADRRDVPAETLRQRLIAINLSQQMNQQWLALRAQVTAQWAAENAQATAAQNSQTMSQFNRNLEHQRKMSASIQETGDYIRNSNNERFQNRMGSMDRVTQMNVDTIQGNRTYTAPGGTFKDNTGHQNVWINPNNPNERIYINDSTYNPNADINVNKTSWDKAERR